jgi:hypothetical protein
MAAYKLNIASIACGMTTAEAITAALVLRGVPDDHDLGVTKVNLRVDNDQLQKGSIFATMVEHRSRTIQEWDDKGDETHSRVVEDVKVYPFMIDPGRAILETYAGTKKTIELMATLLAGHCSLPVDVGALPLDVLTSVKKLEERTSKFQILTAKVKDYAHSSYMAGGYGPKFIDSTHGAEFIAEYVEQLAAAKVRFALPGGWCTVTLNGTACFSYTVKDEGDQEAAMNVLRGLLK